MEKIVVPPFILALLPTACAPADTLDAAQNGIEIYQARIPMPCGESMSTDGMKAAGQIVVPVQVVAQ